MDWLDIALHAAIALIAIVILQWLGVPWAIILFINTLVWPLRELRQHRPDYKEIITHPQSLLEWVCPVITGFLVYGVLA